MSGHDQTPDSLRLQLSALMDGELPDDEARFLLRRLEHDRGLAEAWERWQLCGEVMRGRARGTLLPAGFAPGVAAAIALESRAAAGAHAVDARRARRVRWGGGALAASVAAVALLLARNAQDPGTVPPAPAPLAATQVPAPAPARTHPVLPRPAVPDRTSQLAAAVAVADVPRRAIARRTRSARPALPATASATALASASDLAALDPFSPREATIRTKPWPRALLPETTAGGFTVDYGTVDPGATSFYPFEPRPLPAQSGDGRTP